MAARTPRGLKILSSLCPVMTLMMHSKGAAVWVLQQGRYSPPNQCNARAMVLGSRSMQGGVLLTWLMPRQNFIFIALGVYAPHETGRRVAFHDERVGKGCG